MLLDRARCSCGAQGGLTCPLSGTCAVRARPESLPKGHVLRGLVSTPSPPDQCSFCLTQSIAWLYVLPLTPTPPGVVEVCSLLTPQCPPPEARGQLQGGGAPPGEARGGAAGPLAGVVQVGPGSPVTGGTVKMPHSNPAGDSLGN